MPTVDVCLVSYANEAKTLTRWRRDIRPGLKPEWRTNVWCVDNSPSESWQLRDEFRHGYLWQQGKNLGACYGTNPAIIASQADYLLWVCANHGRMYDPTWIEDLLAPLEGGPRRAMSGSLRRNGTPEDAKAPQFIGRGLPNLHIQGGVFLAKLKVLKENLYPETHPHYWGDVVMSWSLLLAGWQLVNVRTICSVWRERVPNPERFKFVHADGLD